MSAPDANELIEALRPFAKIVDDLAETYAHFDCERYGIPQPSDSQRYGAYGKITWGDLRRAHRAISNFRGPTC